MEQTKCISKKVRNFREIPRSDHEVDKSQLDQYRFRQHFRDTVSSTSNCGSEIKFIELYLLRCAILLIEKNNFFKSVHNIKCPILNLETNTLRNISLFESDKYEKVINVVI